MTVKYMCIRKKEVVRSHSNNHEALNVQKESVKFILLVVVVVVVVVAVRLGMSAVQCSAVQYSKRLATACDVSKSTVAHVTTAFNCLKDNRWSCYASQLASQPASQPAKQPASGINHKTNSRWQKKLHHSYHKEILLRFLFLVTQPTSTIHVKMA
uniref:Uncharacterized protein n=1 Tax=Glossina austeni TaxID=7395 RepID=A0A1A9VTW6_GLOAU